MMSRQTDVTVLLEAWNAGDPKAREQVLPLVYEELRSIARGYFVRERRGHTLQATAIVHDAYVRLIENSGIEWRNRAHFVGMAARSMRHILVDHARHRNAAKRGGKEAKLTLVEADALAMGRPPDLLALDDALAALARVDELKASIVELRFFGGLTVAETASYLEIAPATVTRHWNRARAWLYRQLSA